MTTAGDAVSPALTLKRRRAAQLARAPRIPRRRNAAEQTTKKRVAVVLRRGMRPLEFRQVEHQIEALGLASLPVLPGQRKMQVADTPVCGLIVTGSDIDASPMEREMIEQAVRHVCERGKPVLAFSDAADVVLAAAGIAPVEGEAAAVLISGGVQALATTAQIENAMKLIAASAEA